MSASAVGNPFPGLRPFEESDNVLFFGRDEQVDALLERLRERRFVAVIGTSASGKSSLVRAGLLPALHGGFMSGAGARWRIALLRPGSAPAANLAVALESAGVLGTEGAAALRIGLAQSVLDSGERGLIEVIEHAGLRSDENVLIVVDQFEELFRFTQDRDRAAAFVKLLVAAASDPGLPTYVLLTMRSDFLGDCAQFRDLPETINDGLFLVPRLAPEELREVIEGPVGVAGAKITPLLVTRLLNEIGDSPDQLPVLQHALMRTWEVWSERGAGDEIGTVDFDATGGLARALSEHGDAIFERLPERLQPVAEKVFKALTDRGSDNRGIRRPTPFGDLPQIVGMPLEDVRTVVEEFRRPGRSFVMPPSQALEPATVVDIAHESLMRVWDRLETWVQDEAESAQIYRRLADAARLHAKAEAALLVDPQLTIAATWRERNQPTAEWAERYAPGFFVATAFLTESLEERERQRQAAEVRERREQEEQRRKFEAEETAKRDLLERSLLEQQNTIERTRAEAARKLARQTRRLLIATALVTVLTVVLGAFAFLTRTEALVGQSRFLARDANTAVDVGYPVTGMLLALAALPKKVGSPLDRPFVPEALYALENAFPRQQELMDLNGHDAAVFSAAFSPDGRRIVSASRDRTVRVWDAASGAQIAVLRGHDALVLSAAFSPDSGRIVSASEDLTVRVWDAASGAQITVLRGHDRAVRSAAFSPDGGRIVSASEDKTVRVWDAASGAQISLMRGHDAAVWSAAFSPDGGRIVSASRDRTARVWNAASAAQISLMRGHDATVWFAAFSPDGRRIVSASEDRTARVWDAASGAQIALLRGHEDAVRSAAFSPNGRWIVSASADKTVRVWDAASGAQITLMRGHDDAVRSAVFSFDGQRIVSASADKSVRVWDPASGAQIVLLHGHGGAVFSAAFSPDGGRIISASRDRTVRVWDAASGAQIAVLRGHARTVRSAAFSPDGRRIVSASEDKTVRLWDAASGAQIKVLRGHLGGVRSAAFSPDGRRIVTASYDKTVRVWDSASGAQIAVLRGHTSALRSAAFSPDGRRIVSASRDRTARVWDATSGTQIALLRGHDSVVESAVFSPDGRHIVSASYDKTVRVWDSGSGAQIAVLRGHSRAVWSAAFSPDGRRIVSASSDKTVRVWDPASGAQIAVLRGHHAVVYSVAFSADGRRIVTASSDRNVQVWAVAALRDQALIDAARSHVPRQLTAAERAHAYL